MEFSRPEYWSWVPFPTPGSLSDPGIELASLAFPALAGGFFFFFLTTNTTWEAPWKSNWIVDENIFWTHNSFLLQGIQTTNWNTNKQHLCTQLTFSCKYDGCWNALISPGKCHSQKSTPNMVRRMGDDLEDKRAIECLLEKSFVWLVLLWKLYCIYLSYKK